MRYRILLLLILASLLGTPVLVHRGNAMQRCASVPDPVTCASINPEPLWMRPFGILSAASLLFAGWIALQAFQARRREQQMLRAVGVNVKETDLPLEE